MNLLPPNPTDAELLALIEQRQEMALGRVMERYGEELFRRCHSILKDESLARDCVQEVFISLWWHDSPTGIHNLSHFLKQSIRFRSLAMIRDSKFKEKIEQQSLALTQAVLQSDGLDGLLFKELKEKLERVISNFPLQQQQVWRMHREEGIMYKEIASQLGISQKTVEKKMSLSLKALRNEFGDALLLFIFSRLL
ncbi:MAG: sigma-70 family RNA polymerase sigma factor [Sediminibacterium sp.]